MSKNKNSREQSDSVETPPDATEAGVSDVNFTMGTGITPGAESSAGGMASPSTDSTTSASEGKSGPLGGASSDASGASKRATDSGDAPSTEDKKKALKGEDAKGAGPTHVGTDTPEVMVSNPADPDTGLPLHKEATHSDKPLGFDAFKKDGQKDAAADEKK